jgi:hypothetical protein
MRQLTVYSPKIGAINESTICFKRVQSDGLEIEQLPDHGGISCGTQVLEHGLVA